MDLTTVTSYRVARDRDDLRLAPGETVLGGGTWLMSEPQPDTTGLVDLAGMGWTDLEVTPAGLRIAATCTIAELVAFARGRAAVAAPAEWRAVEMFPDAANALLASFKIWNVATVGGNLCRTFAAAAMISLAVALDGVVEVWTPDGTDRRMPVADLPTGNGTNSLAPGEIVRAVELPAAALRSHTVLEKIALAELGRSGAVVTGRRDADGSTVFAVTAATLTPHVMRFGGMPDAAELRARVEAAPDFYTDPLGAADWRRGVSAVLAERARGRLGAP